jgi:hypothetical protein
VLAIMLIIGFGAHNATEGFGIAGPLTGLVKKPSIRFLILVGLIGGGPTFLGTSHRKLMDFDYNVHILSLYCRRSFDLCLTAHV